MMLLLPLSYLKNHLSITLNSDLKTHKRSNHKGVKYKCDQCDYQAATGSHLKTHKRSIHKEVKYKCDQCDYYTTKQYKP